MQQYTVRLPMYVHVSKATKKPLNLNTYRNLHHFSSNKQKQNFDAMMRDDIRKLPRMDKVRIMYYVHPKRRGDFDVANVLSIVDKFFCDSLVKCGILEDDNYKIVPGVAYEFGGFDQHEAHVTAIITDFSPSLMKGQPMRVLLDQEDIQTALDTYITDQMNIPGATGVVLGIEDNGSVSAEVSFGPRDAIPPVTQTPEDDTEEQPPADTERQTLLALAKDAGIKGIRRDMTVETLREKLREHAALEADDDDEDTASGGTGSATGSDSTSDDGGDSSENSEAKTKANPFEESPEESSGGKEATEGDVPPEVTGEAQSPARKMPSIFSDDD